MYIGACDDDSPDNPGITYELEEYHLSDLLEEEWGAHTGNHYNKDFTFVGNQTTFVEITNGFTVYYTLSEDPDCYIFMELFAPGESFSTGAFRALGRRKIEEAHPDEYVFRRFYFGRSLSEIIVCEEGLVTVSRLANNFYKITFDVVMEDGKSLKGSFVGPSIYVDQRSAAP